jgi:hypothetical protein
MSIDEKRALLSEPVYCSMCGQRIKIWENLTILQSEPCPCQADLDNFIPKSKVIELLKRINQIEEEE